MATTPYAAPPDFQGRQNLINNAYSTAVARLGAQQSQLYGQYGYRDGTTDLDTNNQYGSIQQLLHQTGQSLTADDALERGRGLQLDQGLGAQRQRLIQYAAGAQKNQLGQAFTGSLTDIGNQRADATQTYNTDSLSNTNDQANYNSQMSAYEQALASYNEMLASQAQQQAQPNVYGTNTPAVAASGQWGYNTQAPQNQPGMAPKPAPKAKPGKVYKVGGHNV